MLDLRLFASETLDITMPDGSVLHVKKPTERIIIELVRLRDFDPNSAPDVVLAVVNKCAHMILNNNEEGVAVSKDQIAALPVAAKGAILDAFTEMASRINADPTSSSRTTRAAGAKTHR